MLVSLTATLQQTSLPVFTNAQLLASGYVALAISAIAFVVAGLLRLPGIIAAKVWAADSE